MQATPNNDRSQACNIKDNLLALCMRSSFLDEAEICPSLSILLNPSSRSLWSSDRPNILPLIRCSPPFISTCSKEGVGQSNCSGSFPYSKIYSSKRLLFSFYSFFTALKMHPLSHHKKSFQINIPNNHFAAKVKYLHLEHHMMA
ncbi:hypothetical protein FKM82_024570 [Ascaphus truei]